MSFTDRLTDSRNSRLLLTITLIIFLIFGFLVFDDYGLSWDEPFNYEAGREALKSYRVGSLVESQGIDYYHGTFYFMFYYLLPKILTTMGSRLLETDFRHLLNYFTFIIGAVSLYSLATRFQGPRVGVLAAFLFLSQPLFIGHAFINQKDTPFMAFFLASMALGLTAVLKREETFKSRRKSFDWKDLGRNWSEQTISFQIISIGLILIACWFLLEMIFPIIILPLAERVVTRAYQGQAWGPIQAAFQTIATDSYKTPLPQYLEKLSRGLFWFETFVFLNFIGAIVMLIRTRIPAIHQSLLEWWSTNRWIIFAGVMLGFTVATRLFGMFAGALVSLYLILHWRKFDWRFLVGYSLLAGFTTYLVWPALWGNPIEGLLSRTIDTIDFEAHNVFYTGITYSSDELPWHYLPNLFLRQLSEPLMVGLLIGLWVIWKRFHSKARDFSFTITLTTWFLFPIFAQILFKFSIYGNFRQLLFITPPLFLLGALGLEKLIQSLSNSYAQFAILIGIFIPLIIHVAAFHPYEYIYYNHITRGVRKAHGEFALDYWCTSYREAIERLNTLAPPGSRVLVMGPDHIARPFARPDLEIIPEQRSDGGVDYELVCSHLLPTLSRDRGRPPLFTIARGGVVLTEVY